MRLFIAVNLSPQQQKEVDLLQQRLKKDLQGIKWVPRENLHLTLKFIGEVPEEKLDAIVQGMQESLAGGKPFPLQLEDGVFPRWKGPGCSGWGQPGCRFPGGSAPGGWRKPWPAGASPWNSAPTDPI